MAREKKEKRRRGTWRRSAKNGLSEEEECVAVSTGGCRLESLEPLRPGDARVFAAVQNHRSVQRLQHRVPHLDVGEDDADSVLVAGQSAENLVDPLLADHSNHLLAEIAKESLASGSESFQGAQVPVTRLRRFRRRHVQR